MVKKWTKKESIIIMKKLFNEELKWDEDDIKLNLSKQTFKEYGLQSMLINLYKGSPYSAIKELYPNIKPWELKNSPRNYWNKETGKEVLYWLFNDKLKWDENDIKLNVNKQIFKEYGLQSMLTNLYKGSPYNAIKELYPNIKPWELKWCPRNYWNKETTIRAICWLFNDKLKWNKNDVLNKATKKIFIENNLGSMIHYIYKDNISKVVNDVLPYIVREY